MSAPTAAQLSQPNMMPLAEGIPSALQETSSGSGVLQIIEEGFSIEPRRMMAYLVRGLAVVIGAAILALGYLLAEAISFHNATAQAYLAAIGTHAGSATVLLLGGLGLWAAPSPVKR